MKLFYWLTDAETSKNQQKSSYYLINFFGMKPFTDKVQILFELNQLK